MPHRFAFALVRHEVLLRASGFADEPKFSVTKLLARFIPNRSSLFGAFFLEKSI